MQSAQFARFEFTISGKPHVRRVACPALVYCVGMGSVKVVITGGPCAGKTSAMDVLRAELARRGVAARLVPEAATDLILSGVAPWTCASMLEFQTQVIRLQLEREAAAFAGGAALVVCDRGVCDSHAYLSDADYGRALAANGLSARDALARYDAVFHLESVAKASPGAYTRANNSARFEDAHEAAAADDRTLAAWAAHPRVRVIANEASFERKAANLVAAIAALI